MLRSFFFTVGLFILLVGAGLLYVDHIVLNVQEEVVTSPQPVSNTFRGMYTSVNPDGKMVIVPSAWSPYALLSAGAVALIYATALPRRSGK